MVYRFIAFNFEFKIKAPNGRQIFPRKWVVRGSGAKRDRHLSLFYLAITLGRGVCPFRPGGPEECSPT